MHACGHNIQVSVMYGVAAAAMTRCSVLDQLGGNIEFMAVPAEEYIELDYRSRLKRRGKDSIFFQEEQEKPIRKGAF